MTTDTRVIPPADVEHHEWCDANGCRCGKCPCLGPPSCVIPPGEIQRGSEVSWNYRITKNDHPDQGGYTEYAIREVYYNEDGSIKGWTENPITLSAETDTELVTDIELIRKAAGKATIDITDEDNPREIE